MEPFNLFNMLGEDDESNSEEMMGGLAAGIGATKKVASKKSAQKKAPAEKPSVEEKKAPPSKAAASEKKPAPKKPVEKPASPKAAAKKPASPAPKKSDYAKSLSADVDEWSEGPTKKLTSLEPEVPIKTTPEVPSVNTAATEEVAANALQKAEEAAPPVSPVKEAAEVVENEARLPPSKTFGETVYGDAPPSAPGQSPKISPTSTAAAVEESAPSILNRFISKDKIDAASRSIASLSRTPLGKIIASSLKNAAGGAGTLPFDPLEKGPFDIDKIHAFGRMPTRQDLVDDILSSREAFYPTPEGSPVSEMDKDFLSRLYSKVDVPKGNLFSSKEDSANLIAEDVSRLPPSQEKNALAPEARTISAGEPDKEQVDRLAKKQMLTPIVGEKLAEQLSLTNMFNEQLMRARESENQGRLGAGLGEAAQRLGAAIAGVEVGDVSPWRQQAQAAEGRVKKVKEFKDIQEEIQRNDPNSSESKAARELLKEQGITVPDTVSAAFIEKQYPQFTAIITRKESARQETIKRQERAQERLDRLKEKLEGKNRELALRLAPKIQNKKYETYTELASQKALVDQAVRNPDPQRDITIFYSFVKALDPESVVREGELKFVQTSRSIPAGLRQTLKNALTGEKLSKEERLRVQDFMNQRLELAQKQWQDSAAPYLKQTNDAGISQELVAPGTAFFSQQPTTEKTQASSKPGYKGQIVRQNGIEYKWNEQLGEYE
jgi:protein-tyrosine-phosphatase